MSEEKELSQSFKKMKESYLRRKKEETIRPEDMREEEFIWYTIRKEWKEEDSKKKVEEMSD